MKLLVLGGTKFLGKHVVQHALGAGYEVTMFNRGQTNPQLFPDVEKLRGDRDGDLGALKGRSWDVVIDPSAYVPRIARDSAEVLQDNVERYVFVSSISVYANGLPARVDEYGRVATLTEPTEEVTGETYGALKALSEQAVLDVYGERAALVRAGLIVGPDDPTDRFTYWPVRVADGGEVLAPGPPSRHTQFVDVRDLAAWMVDRTDLSGRYNATGPAEPLSIGEMLGACKEAVGSDARFEWVDEGFILEQGVEPWSEIPAWIPTTDAESANMLEVDVSRALDAGLRFRPVTDTARDTLEWHRTRPADHEWQAGLDRDREREVLAIWHSRKG